MMLFGIGTSPLLLGLSRSARYACAIGPQRLRLARPIALTLLGMLLVWRGVAGPAVHASSGNGGHDGHGVMPPATLAVR
jgi:sulfite exporter TauE/SafE